MLREMVQFAGLVVQHSQRTLALVQGGSDRTADALLVPLARLELVDDQLDEMRLVAVHGLDGPELLDLPVDTHLGVSPLAHLLEKLAVMTLAAAHERTEQQALATFEAGQDQGRDLFVGIAHHFGAAGRRIGTRSPRIQQAEEVIDFGDGPHRGARVGARGLLLDRNDGTQALDALHLGFLQDAHEMLGIGGKGVHITPLPFRIERVEGERGLAAAAQAGHDDEFPPGNVHVDILQVVRPRTPDLDLVLIGFRRRLYVLHFLGHRDTKIAKLCRYPCF